MKIKELVIETRKELGETQEQFAKRFKTTANTVSRWETGAYEVPNNVIEELLERKTIEVICSKCMGTGMMKKLHFGKGVSND